MMDLNKVPSDHMVNDAILEGEIKMGNFDTSCNYSEVEKRCREVEEKCLALQIQNKEIELVEIKEKIRVLEGKRVNIEGEMKGLWKKKANLGGIEIIEVVDEMNEYRESDEECKIDQLVIENKVLECEKGIAIREVEEWKGKCKEFELLVRELEKRLSCQGPHSKDGGFTGVKEDIKDVNVVGSSNFGSETCSPGVVDDGIQFGGISSLKKHVKRQLGFCSDRSCDQKIAPSTPAGARDCSMAVINIDSDQEPDTPTEHGLCLQSEVSPSVLPPGTTIEENEINDEGNDLLVKSPKRKRDLMVVTSDDELVENEVIPKRRALKIDDSENEGEEDKDDDDALFKTPKRMRDLTLVTSHDELEENEVIPKRRALKIDNSEYEGEEDDDDALPIKHIFNRGKFHRLSDDEDNIPISQLFMNRGQGSRSDDCHSLSRPKRRLIKCGESANIDRNQEMKHSPDSLTDKYVEDGDGEDENDSGSDDSLRDFIVDDTHAEDLEDDLSEDSNRHSDEPEEGSDDNLSYADIISKFQRRKDPDSEWAFQADMLSDFGKDPELCMRGVCAIYRRQITKEQSWINGIDQHGRGFNKYDLGRGSILSDFLTDGNPEGDVVKTVEELLDYDPEGPEVCRTLAGRYSKQLFDIYKDGEDPFFP